MTDPVFHQEDGRFGNDDGALEANTLMGTANNQNQTIDVDTTFRLRVVVQQTVSGKSFNNTIFALYASYGGGTYFEVTTTSTYVKLVNDAYSIADHATTAQRIGDGTYTTGVDCEGWSDGQTDAPTGNVDWVAAAEAEVEFSLQIVAADVADEDTLDFRVYESDGTAFGSYGTTLRATANEGTPDALTASDITSGTPTLDQPVIARIVNLTGTDVTSGTPTLDQPVITRIVNLTGTDVTSGTPTLDQPVVGEPGGTDDLTASDVTAGTPTLDQPVITRIVNLAGTDLTAGTPTLDQPVITRIVNLTGTDVTSGTPTLDLPTVAEPGGTDDLTAADLLAAAVLFDLPLFFAYTTTPAARTSTPVLDALSSAPAAAQRTSYPY